MLQALAFAGSALAAALGVSHAAASPLSALPWPSGAKDGGCLAALRGAPLDVEHWHVSAPTYPGLVTAAQKWITASSRRTPAPVVLLSFALLPAANKGQFAECARGDFDTYWQAIGTALSRIDTGHSVIVEPGWEANLGSAPHPWGVDDIAQVPDYRACFQRASTALRLTYPVAKVAWTNSKIYRRNYTPDDMMPDAKSFDYFGLMYYDNVYNPRPLPKLPITQATWDKNVNGTNGTGGSPSGIGSWLAYATAHGKPLGVSEWGLWDTAALTAAQADDPVYVGDMAAFFRANAPSIAYESYQNNGVPGTDDHRLCPTTAFPDGAAAYAAAFGPAVTPPPAARTP
jgi:hypothetical protein